ncbi:hypothetical protein COBT_003521, partial [Conglomerata obtusa]
MEKSMLAVVFGIGKFACELKAKRFMLETDRKALEHIRQKPLYDNNQINQWIELIQEYDFK